ncbi:MAG: anti-sigma factor antagonist [Thermoleophilaceae bacterium]
MARWTRFVIAHRKRVVLAWLVCLVFAGAASSHLSDLLSNRFVLPGSQSEKGFDVLKDHFGEQGQDYSLVVVRRPGVQMQTLQRLTQFAANRGAKAAKGTAGQVRRIGPNMLIAQITTAREYKDASDATPSVRKAIGRVPGASFYLTGAPAIDHDIQPLYSKDLQKGESIAAPIALLVLAFMLGTLGGIAVPIVFALVTIPTTLGLVWIFAHFLDMAVYVTNIVTLIGFAIAIDYSMLIVFRYREELRKHEDAHDALVETMSTAGRATVFSGMTVALGLGLLILMPVPFMQSMGVGGILVPLVSILACVTFLPALLGLMGHKVNRLRVVPRAVLDRRAFVEQGMWARLARSIMRRPIPYLTAGGLVMLALIVPATQLKLEGGDNRGVPKTTEATKGLALLERTLGPGSLAPNQIVVDTGRAGGALSTAAVAQQRKLVAFLRTDREVDPRAIIAPAGQSRAAARKASLIDPTARYYQVRAPGHGDTGTQKAMDLVKRIRDDYVPRSGLDSSHAFVTGGPAFGVDFIDLSYGAFPWLVAAVLVLTYLVLLRAFRSVFLPLKAVLMNVVSVTATYGVLVLAFQHHWGSVVGWQQSPQIEAWIPIFLFAMLFGLSMDYEVFLLSRMREEWDKSGDNEYAVASGLQHTGRIITAAAIIMVAAFSGFAAGHFVGLQMFGLGLSAAIFLDATIVRTLLVPAVMRLLGKWNWYLPERLCRIMRLSPADAAVAAHPERATAAHVSGLLRVDAQRVDGTTRLVLQGELDLATREVLRTELDAAEASAPKLLVIDLRELSYMDSAGLAELVGAAHRAQSGGRRVALVKGPEPIERTLDVAGVRAMFDTVAD